MGLLDAFLKKHKQKFPDQKVTYTHLALKSLAYTIKGIKNLNSTISFGSFRLHDDVNISCLVDVDGKNLVPMMVKKCDKLNVGEIQQQMRDRVKALKTKRDKNFNHQMSIVKMLHSSIVSAVLTLTSFLAYKLGLNIPSLKIKKFGFGNAIVTNCTQMEIYNSFAPLVPFTNCIFVVVLCKPRMRAMVDDEGKIVAKNMMNINVTFDHRYACLLYTSPSPRDLSTSRMPSSA